MSLTFKVFGAIQTADIVSDYSSGLEFYGHIVAIHCQATVHDVCHAEDVVTMDPETVPDDGWRFIWSCWVSSNHSESVVTMWDACPVKDTR